MNDPQLTELFREQLRDETSRAPGFDELWSKAASRHRSARIRKFAGVAIFVGCFVAAAFVLVPKEKSPVGVESGLAATPELPKNERAPQVAEPYRFLSESDADRLEEINERLKMLRSKDAADQKRAAILDALNQPEEAARLKANIATRRPEIAAALEVAMKLENAGKANPEREVSEPILPGENVELTVNEHKQFDGRYVVRRGGYIIVASIGRVPIAGKSVSEAAATIRASIRSINPNQEITVALRRVNGTEEKGNVVYLAGEFRSPRPYRIPENTSPTLLSILLSSGGWTDRADLTKVKVLRVSRNKPTSETYDVKAVLEGALPGKDPTTLQGGDVIVLSAGTLDLIYVTGGVKRPGSYRIAKGGKLSSYGAILQSGGLEPGFDSSNTYILRKLADGSETRIGLDIVGIQSGKIPDTQLMANDIIVVDGKNLW
jgi:protein involved in polysaccharide export with SLBB domain